MKILYLLFAVFFLVLQSSPGFTQFISNSIACRYPRGFCRYTCDPDFIRIGSCDNGQSCCRTIG